MLSISTSYAYHRSGRVSPKIPEILNGQCTFSWNLQT